jgi:ferredoxin
VLPVYILWYLCIFCGTCVYSVVPVYILWYLCILCGTCVYSVVPVHTLYDVRLHVVHFVPNTVSSCGEEKTN